MTLRKKLLRDILENKGTFFALVFLIAMGLSMFVAMNMTMKSLVGAIDRYYEESAFGDLFARVENIPKSGVERLLTLPGIKEVTARYEKDERVLFEGSEENIYIRLLSFDPADRQGLNRPHVFSGLPIRGAKGGVYLSPGFADAHGLGEGDTLPVLINGRKKELLILGVGQSPEYIYAVSGASDIFPNPALFGVALAPESLIAELYDSPGAKNSLSFRLAEGTKYTDVENLLKDRLEKYGLKELVPRKDQISNFMLDAEVGQMQKMGQSLPVLLLLISAVIMLITLRRRVESQRGQIGIMLAFGYTPFEILWHYVSYGVAVGAAGGLLGTLLGWLMLGGFVDLYKAYFIIPGFIAGGSFSYLVLSPLLAVFSSAGACLFGCREVLKLEPAIAMRPPAPPVGKNVFFEKIPLFWSLLTTAGKMAVRNMVRAPFRSMVSLLGVSLVYAMMAVVFSFNNMIDVMIRDQFEKVETYDVKMSFNGLVPDGAARRELSHFEGVTLVETVLEAPATLRNKNFSADTAILGLSSDARLYNILDEDQNLVSVAEGAVLSKGLADKLGVSPGDLFYVDSPYLQKPKPIAVKKIIPQYLGSNLYMEKSELWEFLGRGEVATSAMLLADPQTVSELKSAYRLSGKIRGVSRADESFAMMTDFMDSYVVLIYIMGLFVALVGFVIVYNSAVISFSERSRELASLLVLGMLEKEAAEVISFEQWVLSMAGVVLGIPFSLLLNRGFADALQNDIYAMPDKIPPEMLLLSFCVTFAYLYIAQLRIGQKIKTLKIVDVLKERE